MGQGVGASLLTRWSARGITRAVRYTGSGHGHLDMSNF